MADLEDDDPDRIISSYDVYIKPHMSGTQQVYVLQFPNRDSRQPYSERHNSQPLKMRTKPNAGMVELDVPMDVRNNYDKEKGVRWGGAMKKSKANHGLPGGFGIGGSITAGRGRQRNADEVATQQALLNNFENAVREEQVLVKQTLGGQTIPIEENTPQYMIGTFDRDKLYLTPVDSIVQMRPQFHHIDAQAEQDRILKSAAAPSRVTEARAVHMTVKSNIDGEEDTTDTMAQRISAAQTEQWKSHRFVDEDDEKAWDAYKENLFAGKETGNQERDEILAELPKLQSVLDDREYLDFLSAPRDATKLSKKKSSKKGKEQEAVVVESDSSNLSDTSEEEDEIAGPV